MNPRLGVLVVPLMSSALAVQCGTFPALDVKTSAGYCVAIVQKGLNFPRGVLPLKSGKVLVTEMGSWAHNKGALSVVTPGEGTKRLFTGLDRPHGIRMGPDGKVYYAEDSRIMRFDLSNPAKTRQVFLDGLPDTGRHPLKTFVFDLDNNLIVNFGSATDNCEDQKGLATCKETQSRALLKKYLLDWSNGGKVGKGQVLATGLRNSMGLAVHPSGTLLQAENSRDSLGLLLKIDDEDLPHDELNVVQQGKFYGWPYCHDLGQNAPEFKKFNCQQSQQPTVLLPGHSAPLGMAYAPAGADALLQNKVVIGLHGYRQNGHRIVMYTVNAQGIPAGKPSNLVWDWDTKPGQKQGAPVDLAFSPDGGLYFTDDKNGMLLKFQKR